MNLSIFYVQILTSLAYGMLLFMIAGGLSIIFGLMNVTNMTHGTFFMVGTYLAFSLINHNVNFWVALVLSVLAVAVLGLFIERVLLKRLYGKELQQALLTFGLAFIIGDLTKWIWGSSPQMLSDPKLLDFSISVGTMVFPAYRLFVVAVGCVVAFLFWYFESRTRIGAIIRAGVDDRDMLSALGINVKLVFSMVFAFGAGLAGLGGVLAGSIIGVYTGLDFEILILSLVVVVIGGLGTWKGSFIGAILIGLIETLGRIWFPTLSMVLIFALMVVVLLVKPSGLFGRGAQS